MTKREDPGGEPDDGVHSPGSDNSGAPDPEEEVPPERGSRSIPLDEILPTGFAQSLLPKFKGIPKPWTNPTNFASPSVFGGLDNAKLANFVGESLLPHFSAIRSLGPWVGDAIADIAGMSEQHLAVVGSIASSGIFETLRAAMAPYVESFAAIPRLFLPPNLRDASGDISAADVYEFVEEEGIPLYLVPRAAIARRLIRAKTHAARRKVLNDRFNDIVDDCVALLATCTDRSISTEVHFIRDGIGALKAGHHTSAQALFTVTLDGLIIRFYPNKKERAKITNRKKGAPMPDKISDMGLRAAYVWLPIWNAHEEFWRHQGDTIPNDYSRHASVHGASKKQFNKRNCVQSLMLATSLVGYAQQLSSARASAKSED